MATKENTHIDTGHKPYTLEEMFGVLDQEPSPETGHRITEPLQNDPVGLGTLDALDRDPAPVREKQAKVLNFRAVFKEEVDRLKKKESISSAASFPVHFYKVAAILLVLINVGVFGYFLSDQNQKNAFVPYDLSQDIARGHMPEDTGFELGVKHYRDKKYREAIAAFDQLPADHPMMEKALFLKANANIGLDQPEEALVIFEEMLEHKNWFLYRPHIYKSMAAAQKRVEAKAAG